MCRIPTGASILSDNASAVGEVACRTYIWRSESGGYGALVVQDAPGEQPLRIRLDDVPTLPELDRLILAELNNRTLAHRLPLLHSAAGAYERATWQAA